MPRGDRTGPVGFGPATGRGRGLCTGYEAPGFMGPFFGFGRGRGLGRGFGWRRFWNYGLQNSFYGPAIGEDEEREILKEEKEGLEKELKEVRDRLAKLGIDK